jgi:phosphatidate cytidylyltransferase
MANATVIGIILVVVLFTSIWFINIPFVMLACALSTIIYFELKKILSYLFLVPLIVLSILMIVLTYFFGTTILSILFFVFLGLLLLWGLVDRPSIALIPKLSQNYLAFIYIGLSISFLMLTVAKYNKYYIILMFLAYALGSDACGHLVGTTFGKHRLSAISPGKTVEGFIGSIFGSIFFTFLCNIVFSINFSVLYVITLGTLIAFVATMGDLFESLFKRAVGIKDISDVIMDHGGFLDRFDSALFVFPAFYIFVSLIRF